MEVATHPAIAANLTLLPYSWALVILSLCSVFYRYLYRDPLRKIPLYGLDIGDEQARREAYAKNGIELHREGSRKYKDTVFRLTTSDAGEKVVVPPKYLKEISKIPDDVLNIEGGIRNFMEYDFTGIPSPGFLHITPRIVRADLTPAIARLSPILFKEIVASVDRELPKTATEWTPVFMHRAILRIVATVSGRIFVGLEINRREEYVEAAIMYTVETMTAARAIKQLKPWLRRIYGHFLPQVKSLKKRETSFRNLLMPLFQERRDKVYKTSAEKPDDVLQWILDECKAQGLSDDNILQIQIGLTFGAIHTTAGVSTNLFYNLAAYQEYIAPLRAEISDAMECNGGKLDFVSLQSLKKLDSFLKETSRTEVSNAAVFQRKALRPFTLSDGTYIPAGTFLTVPALEVTRNPDIYPDPEQFEGWRFLEGHDKGARLAKGKRQFLSVHTELLTFGTGRHACPGRFFAANVIKMMAAYVLMNYELKMPEGEPQRYKNLQLAASNFPDPTKTILFRRSVARRVQFEDA